MKLFVLFVFLPSVLAISGTISTVFKCHKVLEWEEVNGNVTFNMTMTADKTGMHTRITSGLMCEGGNSGDFTISQEEQTWNEYILDYWPKSTSVFNESTISGKFTTLCVFICPDSTDTTATYEAYEVSKYQTNEYELYTNVMGFGACATIGNRYSEGGVSVNLVLQSTKPVKLIVETGLDCGIRYFSTSVPKYYTIIQGGTTNKILEPLYFFNVTDLSRTIFIPNLISSLYCYIVCPNNPNQIYQKYRLHYKIDIIPAQGDKVSFDNVRQLTNEIVDAQIKNSTQEVVNVIVAETSVKLQSFNSRIEKIENDNSNKILGTEWIGVILGSIGILLAIIAISMSVFDRCQKTKSKSNSDLELNKSFHKV